MFVWVFHRISGVLLILLMVFQVSTGVTKRPFIFAAE